MSVKKKIIFLIVVIIGMFCIHNLTYSATVFNPFTKKLDYYTSSTASNTSDFLLGLTYNTNGLTPSSSLLSIWSKQSVFVSSSLYVDGLSQLSNVTVTNTLSVTNLSTLTGGFVSVASSSVGNTLSITGATTVSSTFSVSGLSTLGGFNATASSSVGSRLSVTGATTVSSTLSVLGATTLSNTLNVTGLSTLTGFNSTASSSVGNTLSITGATTVSSTLSVSGLSTLTGFLSTASSSVNSGLQVSGALNASSTLFVKNLSTFTGGFVANASSSITSQFSVNGPFNASSSAYLSGVVTTTVTTFNVGVLAGLTRGFNANASSSVQGGLQVSGALNASSSLYFTGSLIGNQTLSNQQGLFNIDSSGNTSVSGTLRVFGLSTLQNFITNASSSLIAGLSIGGPFNASSTANFSQNVFQYGIPPVFGGGRDNDSSASSTAIAFNDMAVAGRYTFFARNEQTGACSVSSTAGCEIQIYDNTTSTPTFVGGADVTVNVVGIRVAGNFAYITLTATSAACNTATGANCEFQIWNIADVSNPKLVSSLELGNSVINTNGMAVWGHFIYIVRNNNGSSQTCSTTLFLGCNLVIVDVANSQNPILVGGQNLGFASTAVIANGGYLYIGKAANASFCSVTSTVGCEFMQEDISTPTTPSTTAVLDLGINVLDLQLQGKYLYIGKGIDGAQPCSNDSQLGCELIVYDVSSATSSIYVGGAELNTQARSLSINGRYLYVGKTSDASTCDRVTIRGCEVVAFDVFTSSTQTALASFSTFQYVGGVDNGGVTIQKLVVAGHYLYAGTAGNTGTCSAASPIGCEAQTFDLGGTELSTLIANALEAGSLQVRDNAYFDQNVTIRGGLTVGMGGEFIQGGSSIVGWLNMASSTLNSWQGVNVASANNITLGTGNLFVISGTTQINTISTTSRQYGSEVTLQFLGSVTVKHNTAGTGASLFLAGSADFSATVSDTLKMIYSNFNSVPGWYEESRTAI